MKELFFTCKHCGNIIAMIRDSGVPIQCCGENMEKIIPGTIEASEEKHIPVYKREDDTVIVSVGSVEHPMEPEHYIEWVCIESDDGFSYKQLKPNTPPKANFLLHKGDNIKAVYAFCNQHSLWKTK